MNEPKRYLITAALPYANGPLHIGHIAGAYLPADIYVRYLKANNKDVAFVCGHRDCPSRVRPWCPEQGRP